MNKETYTRDQIRTIMRSGYAMQKLRIQMGNRIVANFRAKLGQEPSTSEEELDKEAIEIMNTIRVSYNKITDGVINQRKFLRNFKGDEVISSSAELVLVQEYENIHKSELNHFDYLKYMLEAFPIYTEFLLGVKGVGHTMASVIIGEFDIHKARYPSSLHAYAGLDVAEDGRGRGKYKEHLVEVEYTNYKGEKAVRNSITFNPFLKTKLTGVLGPSMLRSGSPYALVYNNYKNRLQNHVDKQDWTKMHIHRAAIRYMIKIFLIDLYAAWRPLEGLEVSVPYHEAKLGLKHESPVSKTA